MMEIITSHDKNQRDRLFDDLRQNGNELERQVVKFSGAEEIENPEVRVAERNFNGKKAPVFRKQYRSTWSVAYPKS